MTSPRYSSRLRGSARPRESGAGGPASTNPSATPNSQLPTPNVCVQRGSPGTTLKRATAFQEDQSSGRGQWDTTAGPLDTLKRDLPTPNARHLRGGKASGYNRPIPVVH